MQRITAPYRAFHGAWEQADRVVNAGSNIGLSPSPGVVGYDNGNSGNFSMAFQPIVDVDTSQPFAYEALHRGIDGEPASSILHRAAPHDRTTFDHGFRIKAIQAAIAAGLLDTEARLSVNFLPLAVETMRPCMALTLRAAKDLGFPLDRLILELTEAEPIASPERVSAIVRHYRRVGLTVAIDDFGAGHSGLALLARFVPDMVKLDIGLIHGIDGDRRRRAIVAALVSLCAELRTIVIAEGVETIAEASVLRDLGIRYMQGYLFARPAFERLPEITMPVFV